MDLIRLILPELLLIGMACVLFLMGVSGRTSIRRAVPMLALLAVAGAFALELGIVMSGEGATVTRTDPWNTFSIGPMAHYIRLLVTGVGVLLLLLAWPTNAAGTGSESMDLGPDVGEFFGLMLLSISGVLLVTGANDLVLLFLAIELASIPTYVMVSMSRPLAVAQEAGVKYFFLGAMAAAVMLFGFSYLYGVTGQTKLNLIADYFANPTWTPWTLLAIVMVVAGFAFKIAAVPLHAYAGDVYQGAATPVTAFLAFIPKTSGFVALIRVFTAITPDSGVMHERIWQLLWIIAVLTMTVGNVLGLLQSNIKRVLAYSSVAHSGYMLVGLTAMALTDRSFHGSALQSILFYLAAYGIMNAAAFGVLMMLPSRGGSFGQWGDNDTPPPTTTAETFEDLAGQGRRHPVLGLAMAVACFSLIGLPLTIGFLGKFYLIKPALNAGAVWLVVLMMVNAAISAAYYLRIVATMFLRPDPDTVDPSRAATRTEPRLIGGAPVMGAVAASVALTLLLGTYLPATQRLVEHTAAAAAADARLPAPAGPSAIVSR